MATSSFVFRKISAHATEANVGLSRPWPVAVGPKPSVPDKQDEVLVACPGAPFTNMDYL